MKITTIQQYPLVMVKDDPKWKNALEASPTSDGILLLINTDKGVTGIGYAGANAPYKGVGPEVLQTVLQKYGTYLEGRDPLAIEKILDEIDEMELPSASGTTGSAGRPFEPYRARAAAEAAIDIALHDILGKVAGLPVYQLLGGLVREQIPILRILAIKPPAEMALNAVRLVAEGYRYLKLKMEGDAAEDLRRVRAVREAVGPGIHLTTDPNQSYSPEAAIEAITQWEQFGVEIVEQPVNAEDLAGLARVSRGVNCLVEAHESADSIENVFQLVKEGMVRSIAVSPSEIGGIREAGRMVDICRAGKVKCHVACVGSRILSAACLHLAASSAYVSYACQLGEFSRFLNDKATGMEIDHGVLRVTGKPGLGIEINL